PWRGQRSGCAAGDLGLLPPQPLSTGHAAGYRAADAPARSRLPDLARTAGCAGAPRRASALLAAGWPGTGGGAGVILRPSFPWRIDPQEHSRYSCSELVRDILQQKPKMNHEIAHK